ncbi:hypothetical protein BDR05DRAFT_954615 [Suillus weaverae]|nr:hypothetical protein BDR05DRAFT_954615 [Suillus weaverae]
MLLSGFVQNSSMQQSHICRPSPSKIQTVAWSTHPSRSIVFSLLFGATCRFLGALFLLRTFARSAIDTLMMDSPLYRRDI